MSESNHSIEGSILLDEAAEFLRLHPVTLQRKARRGEVPAFKIGKCWAFFKIDLIEFVRAQYSPRVMQGAHKEVELCRSTNAVISGITSCAIAEKSYRKALGLPTK